MTSLLLEDATAASTIEVVRVRDLWKFGAALVAIPVFAGIACMCVAHAYLTERAEARASMAEVDFAACTQERRGLEVYIGQNKACSREVDELANEMKAISRDVERIGKRVLQ